jgi:hypothetical protein
MGMNERMTFQSAFSLKIWVGERVFIIVKKVFIMSSVNHYDVFGKTS